MHTAILLAYTTNTSVRSQANILAYSVTLFTFVDSEVIIPHMKLYYTLQQTHISIQTSYLSDQTKNAVPLKAVAIHTVLNS